MRAGVWRCVYRYGCCFILFWVFLFLNRPPLPPFSKASADMLNSESNQHNLPLGECGMSHSCRWPVCSLVCTRAIHSPHHLPIPLTFIRSSPSNRSDWLVFHPRRFSQRESRRASDLNKTFCQKCDKCLFFCPCVFPRCAEEFFSQSGHKDQRPSHLGISREQ